MRAVATNDSVSWAGPTLVGFGPDVFRQYQKIEQTLRNAIEAEVTRLGTVVDEAILARMVGHFVTNDLPEYLPETIRLFPWEASEDERKAAEPFWYEPHLAARIYAKWKDIYPDHCESLSALMETYPNPAVDLLEYEGLIAFTVRCPATFRNLSRHIPAYAASLLRALQQRGSSPMTIDSLAGLYGDNYWGVVFNLGSAEALTYEESFRVAARRFLLNNGCASAYAFMDRQEWPTDRFEAFCGRYGYAAGWEYKIRGERAFDGLEPGPTRDLEDFLRGRLGIRNFHRYVCKKGDPLQFLRSLQETFSRIGDHGPSRPIYLAVFPRVDEDPPVLSQRYLRIMSQLQKTHDVLCAEIYDEDSIATLRAQLDLIGVRGANVCAIQLHGGWDSITLSKGVHASGNRRAETFELLGSLIADRGQGIVECCQSAVSWDDGYSNILRCFEATRPDVEWFGQRGIGQLEAVKVSRLDSTRVDVTFNKGARVVRTSPRDPPNIEAIVEPRPA